MTETLLILVFLFPGVLTFVVCLAKERVLLALLLPWFSWLGLLLSLVAGSARRTVPREPARVERPADDRPAADRLPISGMEAAWQAGMILAIIGAAMSLFGFNGRDQTRAAVVFGVIVAVAVACGLLYIRLKWERERRQAELDAIASQPLPPPLPGANLEARLAELDALRHRGVISDQEHATARARTLTDR